MPYDKVIKKGATGPPWDLIAYLDGRPRNITGYEIKMYIRYLNPVSGTLVVNGGDCTIVNGPAGMLQYPWPDGGMTNIGLHFCEVWLTKDSKTIKLPEGRDTYLTLYVSEDVGS